MADCIFCKIAKKEIPSEIVYEDDQFDVKKASTAAKKLIESDDVSASLIGMVNTAKAVGPFFEQAQTPLMVLWDANEELENIGDYTYGIGFHTEKAGYAMAEKLYQKGIRNVAVLRHIDEWFVVNLRARLGKLA